MPQKRKMVLTADIAQALARFVSPPRLLMNRRHSSTRLAKALEAFLRWEFEKGRKALTVSPQGPASFDDPDLVIQAVLDGVGFGSAVEETLTDLIAKGRLIQVLRDWCPSPDIFFITPVVGINLPH